MREPCVCGSEMGRIIEKGTNDLVYCRDCDKFQYNAPRVETGKAVRSVSTTHKGVKPKQRARILMRASKRCELCGASSGANELHVGHMLSVKDGHTAGLPDVVINSDENLCCLCAACNLGMGRKTMPLRLAAAILKARFDTEALKRAKGQN